MEKVLTLIIPTYNMEKYLRKCLSSLVVTEDNMQALEVIVVNDGSKDSSLLIANEYERLYPDTFRSIDKENGNYGSCVNRGLYEAKGKYVKILDADDSFSCEVFDAFLTFLRNMDADLIISDYCVVDEAYKVRETYTFNMPVYKSFTMEDFTESAACLWHHGITYRTCNIVAMSYKQTEGISYTDDEWIFKPMITVRKVCYFPQILYYYLRGREGQTFDPKVMQKTFSHRLIVANSMLRFYEEHHSNFDGALKQYMFSKLFSRIRSLYNLFLIKGGILREMLQILFSGCGSPSWISLRQESAQH